jgi:hypothetical protein
MLFALFAMHIPHMYAKRSILLKMTIGFSFEVNITTSPRI